MQTDAAYGGVAHLRRAALVWRPKLPGQTWPAGEVTGHRADRPAEPASPPPSGRPGKAARECAPPHGRATAAGALTHEKIRVWRSSRIAGLNLSCWSEGERRQRVQSGTPLDRTPTRRARRGRHRHGAPTRDHAAAADATGPTAPCRGPSRRVSLRGPPPRGRSAPRGLPHAVWRRAMPGGAGTGMGFGLFIFLNPVFKVRWRQGISGVYHKPGFLDGAN